MPPKRSTPFNESNGNVRKKIKIRPASDGLLETKSIEERAEPFRLMTVRFPIDGTTPEWSTGWNRDVNDNHAKQLCHLFEEYGLERSNRANRLRLLCSAQDVRTMCQRLNINCRPNDPDGPLPSFLGWSSATAGPAEVLAGNHRIVALKAYLKQQKLADNENERWWVCNIFDKDTLPLELQIELRANRSGTVLPDTHGQIWTELRTCAEQDKSGTMFSGARGAIEAQMSRALKLNTREQFPVRRLAILWKNDRWRTFITRTCSRRAGKDLFNISIFQKLSSYRIDDYLFERIESIIRPIDVIWKEFGIELELDRDYARLSGLHRRWKPRELFYPKDHDSLDVDEDSPRRSQFLSHVDDSKYHALYRYLLGPGSELSFPIAHELLKTLNSRGKTMQAVMTHVVMWLNNDIASVNDREGNKPPLVEELLSVVSSMLETAIGRDASPAAKTKVLELQRRVLMFVEENAAAFTKDELTTLPEDDTEPDVYQNRFQRKSWKDVLARVREVISERFRNPCVSDLNTEIIGQQPQPEALSLADSLQDVITQHSEIVGDPKLESLEAKEALRVMMEKTVDRWKREYGQCRDGPQAQEKDIESTVSMSELARFREASFFVRSAFDDENSRSRGTKTARDSLSTPAEAARQERTKGSLFVESGESEGDFEPPRAPVARMGPLSPRMKIHGSTQPSGQGQPSKTGCSFSEDDDQAEPELPPARNRSTDEAITGSASLRPQRKEAAFVGERQERLPQTRTSTATLPTSRSSKPPSKGQQKGGWRSRPFARG